jgi:hypothetical protein
LEDAMQIKKKEKDERKKYFDEKISKSNVLNNKRERHEDKF